MSARTKARKRALDILYSADLRQISIPESLASEAERAANEPAREGSWLYAREIVDRAILRIGVWEILFNDKVPEGVAISEAVEAATVLSTDDSAGFVNGLLAKIAQTRLSS
jgi:N utilization substance protein B